MSKLPPLLALAALFAACSTSSSDDAPPDARPPAADASVLPSPDAAPATGLDDFYTAAADAICGALFRCCEQAELDSYFAPYLASDLLADFHDRLPPNAALDEPQCAAVVAEMFAVTPFGDWVEAARRGAVGFEPAAFASCVAALDGAACGAPVRAALYDSTCLGFSPPAGGGRQRTVFSRTAGPGADCAPIRDGVGAAFFGTCDPTTSFCCYRDTEEPELGCTYPFTGDGEPRAGSCEAAPARGDACSAAPPLAICRTGASCDAYTDKCVADADDPLAAGDACVDDGFNLLGLCTDSYCDLFGTKQCEQLRANGDSCTYGYECASGLCDGERCAELTTCDGDATGEPDAGPSGPDAAPMPDAAPVPDAGGSATGETCESATGLAAASSTSSIAGYEWVASGAFGASNDYNPYDSAGLPPACSFVYDAAGAEVVYAVELAPGDRLDLRYAVDPTSIPGGVYLLDGCTPEVTWPDYDGSGACGSNEYRSQGYCGVLGCDPVEWSWTYPTTVDGAPTATHTFWVVLDHLGTTAAAGYQLDWRIVPAD